MTSVRTAPTPPASGIIHNYFSVENEPIERQMPAWSEYVGRILDVPISHSHITGGFRGAIDTYVLKDMIFLDSRTDPVVQVRTAARISTDSMRDYVFHVAVDGAVETVTGLYPQRKAAQFAPGILALDMNQQMRMERPAWARVLAFFLPRAMVESILPDAESIHGRVIAYTSPLTRMIRDHLSALSRDLPAMPQAEAEIALHTCAHLIVAAFGKQARLSGNARAAARAAMFGKVRRYIDENLHQEQLSPENILNALQVPRPTLYRMFEHEGGLGTYIRNRRLREAAGELVEFPHSAVMEIAYGLGFKRASDFTRAFRRAYDMTPLDFRAQALQRAGRDSAYPPLPQIRA